MKIKRLLTLLPLLAIASCSTNGETLMGEPEPHFERSVVNGLPALGFRNNESSHVTYLMMGPFGYISADGVPVKGAIDDLHYENTIVWNGDAGSALPDATAVKTTVNMSTFRGWAFYDEDNDHVWPDYYTTVPSKSGVALKAIFDGTDAGGNTGGGGGSGGGGSGGGGGGSAPGFGIIKGSGEYKIGDSKGVNMDGYDEYLVSGMSFAVGDTFALFDASTMGTWSVDINEYSFAPDPTAPTPDPARVASYVTKNATDYTVNTAFTGDFYIQIKYQSDRLYIQLA